MSTGENRGIRSGGWLRTTGGAHTAPPKGGGSPRVRRAIVVAMVALLLVAALVPAAWFGLVRLPGPVQDGIDLWPDPHAKTGTLAATQTDVPVGSFQLVLDQVVTVPAGTRELSLAFENPLANAYSARVEVVMDDQVIARSGMVAPGSRLDALACDRALDAGEHQATAHVLLYTDGTLASELSVDVTIRTE